jgi:hypothetical protein
LSGTPSAGPSVSPSTATIGIGGTTTPSASGFTGGAVTWSSSDPTKATVNASTGLVTGVAAGSATITATGIANNAQTATCAVTVAAAFPYFDVAKLSGPGQSPTFSYFNPDGTPHTWSGLSAEDIGAGLYAISGTMPDADLAIVCTDGIATVGAAWTPPTSSGSGGALPADGLDAIDGLGGLNFAQMVRAVYIVLTQPRTSVPAEGTAGTITFTGYGTITVDTAGNITASDLTPP